MDANDVYQIFACELQESVIMTMVKLCLKSLQEYVRLQTFNRSGFQQIQLDIQFLRTPLKEIVEDEATMDFLLDEVGTTKNFTLNSYLFKLVLYFIYAKTLFLLLIILCGTLMSLYLLPSFIILKKNRWLLLLQNDA